MAEPQCVLVVDDQSFVRSLLAARLGFKGYRVVQSSNGEEAYPLVASEKPSLIICDILMPGGDGLSLCKRLKAEGNQTPFLFLTTVGQADIVVEGFSIGADDYLTKPFDVNVLEARVNALLRRSTFKKSA